MAWWTLLASLFALAPMPGAAGEGRRVADAGAAARDQASAAAARAAGAPRFRDRIGRDGHGPWMVAVPGGPFMLGAMADEGASEDEYGMGVDRGPGEPESDEHPPRALMLPAFAASQFPVTLADWAPCVAAGACPSPGNDADARPDEAVVGIDWHAAQTYAHWLTRATGRTYRLPSEAEFEYLLRADSAGAYPWGDDLVDACLYVTGADLDDEACEDPPEDLRRVVGQRQANRLGLFDLLGLGRMDWVQDCYHPDHSRARADGAAVDEPDCALRVQKGSPWVMAGSDARISRRQSMEPSNANAAAGLRVVAELRAEEPRASRPSGSARAVAMGPFRDVPGIDGTAFTPRVRDAVRLPDAVAAGLHRRGIPAVSGVPVGKAFVIHRPSRMGWDRLRVVDAEGQDLWPSASSPYGSDWVHSWEWLSTEDDLDGDGAPDLLLRFAEEGNSSSSIGLQLFLAAGPARPQRIEGAGEDVPIHRTSRGILLWAPDSDITVTESFGSWRQPVWWPLRIESGQVVVDGEALRERAARLADEADCALVEDHGEAAADADDGSPDAYFCWMAAQVQAGRVDEALASLRQRWPEEPARRDDLRCALAWILKVSRWQSPLLPSGGLAQLDAGCQ